MEKSKQFQIIQPFSAFTFFSCLLETPSLNYWFAEWAGACQEAHEVEDVIFFNLIVRIQIQMWRINWIYFDFIVKPNEKSSLNHIFH